jgi:hypothetical protein
MQVAGIVRHCYAKRPPAPIPASAIRSLHSPSYEAGVSHYAASGAGAIGFAAGTAYEARRIPINIARLPELLGKADRD